MSHKRPASDPPSQLESDPLEKIKQVLDETREARASLMDQAIHMQDVLRVADTLQEMLTSAHSTVSQNVLTGMSEQHSLQQLQAASSFYQSIQQLSYR